MSEKQNVSCTAPTVPLFIPGLILLLAGSRWFSGASTVGWILVGVSVGPLLVVLIVGLLAFGVVHVADALDGRRRGRVRRRRGW